MDIAVQVLCEAPALQTADTASLWGQLLQSLLAQMDNRSPTTEVRIPLLTPCIKYLELFRETECLKNI